MRNCLKKAHFKWTAEAEKAFLEVKKCLMELPTLTAPHAGEPLTMYLSAYDIVVGSVLLTDMKNLQTPIYYVSRTFTGPETRYSMLEKQLLALVYAARRLAKWAIELGEHAIEYRTRPAINNQVLENFVTVIPQSKEEECLIEQQTLVPPDRDQVCSLYMDGASCNKGSGACLILVNPEGHEFTYAIKLDFKSTNNEAEYEAFLAGLQISKKLGVKHLEARVDSILIAGQINGT
ncbi:uncharacterized protein LOC143555294 [Bidens hawaiensis]|uniref:uncharacterized protein LOC143555294 n=1 Tax=Bidens hawaiensis TaxID=980011 RepID=UPI0040498422